MTKKESQQKYNLALLKIEDLTPPMRVLVKRLIEKGNKLLSPHKILPSYGYRTIIEQDEIYAQGRTKPGEIVTYAKGGYSFHNVRRAVDLKIVDKTGKAIREKSLFEKLAKLKSKKLEWGGTWTKLVDLPHFQYC